MNCRSPSPQAGVQAPSLLLFGLHLSPSLAILGGLATHPTSLKKLPLLLCKLSLPPCPCPFTPGSVWPWHIRLRRDLPAPRVMALQPVLRAPAQPESISARPFLVSQRAKPIVNLPGERQSTPATGIQCTLQGEGRPRLSCFRLGPSIAWRRIRSASTISQSSR
jgi:hypothetical protein